MSTTDPSPPTEVDDWEAVQDGPEFRELRHRLRSFVFPVTGLFLAWYLLYVLLASYAAGFMSIKLVGNVNVALEFGLLQILSTFGITAWYLRFADRRFDPLSTKLRAELEGRSGSEERS